MVRVFTCDNCEETFVSQWTDEEANQEYVQNFGADMGEERAVMCDKCHEAFMTWYRGVYKPGITS
jgi:hypothetical protein